MIQPVTKLLAGLRTRGLVVSTAEGIDAAAALAAVGVESRETLRLALRATLAKGRRDQEVFDEIFDAVFASPLRSGRGSGEEGRRGGGSGGAGRSPEGAGHPGRPPADAEHRPSRAAARSTAPRAGTQDDATHRRRSSERPAPSEPQDRSGRPGPRSLPSGRMTRPEGRLRRIIKRGSAHRLAPEQAGRSESAPRAALASAEAAPAGREGIARLWTRDLSSPMTAEDERRLSEMLPRLLSQIRRRPSRRFRRATSGRVWPRAAVRRSIGTDGVPFVLPLRSRRPRRSRVVLLVDVSWSVARSAGLFLAIALRLLERRRDMRVVVFVDRPVDATDALRGWVRPPGGFANPGTRGAGAAPQDRSTAGAPVRRLRGPVRTGGGSRRGEEPGAAIRPDPSSPGFLAVLRNLPDLSLQAPSDYGRAFWSLASRGPLRGRDTILVVLGDGRVNRFDPQEWAFRDLAERCGAVMWLVPEPRARWGSGDSALPLYLPHCDVAVEAADLDGIVAGVAELQRRL